MPDLPPRAESHVRARTAIDWAAEVAIACQNKRQVYLILFQAIAETLETIAADPRHMGGELGFIAIL